MKNYFITTTDRALSFNGEILSKIGRGFLEKTRILLGDSILPPFQWDLLQ